MNIRDSRTLLSTTIFAALLTFGTASAYAQNQQVAQSKPDAVVTNTGTSDVPATAAPATSAAPLPEKPNLSRVGVQTAQPVPLSINDAIRRALENNNSSEITRDDVRFQETQIRSIIGTYDPVFNVTPTFTRNSTTGSSPTTQAS